MNDSDDDSDVHLGTAGAASVVSPTSSKFEQDPGSNEFVNVVAPEEEESATRGYDIESKTSSVEEVPEPVPIFTNEMPLQLEPESMTETETQLKKQPGVRDNDNDEPQMPGSFDMSTAHPEEQISWAEMLRKLRLT